MRQKTILSAAIAGVLLSAIHHPAALAQSAAPAAGLEELIVTAQRREESILEAPVTVTALGGDLLEQQNVRELTDLVALTPGLEIEPDGARTSIRLRGIATADGTPAAENIAALHVDNIYLSHRTSLEGYFFDVDRVEVLQGPQGTLYGRNTAAGSLNIISRRPSQELEGAAEVEIGSYNRRRVYGMLNLPITDTLALRGAFQSSSRDGYFDSNVDESRSLHGRLALQWDPTDRVSVYLKGDFGDSWRRGNGNGILGTVDNSNPDAWTVTWLPESQWFNDMAAFPEDVSTGLNQINASFSETKSVGLMAEVTFDITDNSQFIVNGARIEDKYRSNTVGLDAQVNDGGVGYGYYGGIAPDRVRGRPWLERVVDARFQGTLAGQLDWTIGYFDFSDDTNEPAGDRNGIEFSAQKSLSESQAIYGQVTWTPPAFDRLHLTAGARTTDDWKQWDFQVVLEPINMVVGGSNGLLTKEWSNDDYKIGVAFDITDTSMIYANHSTGYRAGSWFPGPVPQYDPEYVDAYEIGWKGRLADNRLDLSVNAYYYDYQDMAIGFDAFNTVSMEDEIGMFNLGNAEIFGANLSATWLATDNDILTVNIDYTKSEIVSFDFASALAQYGPNYSFNTVFDWTGLPTPNTTPWRVTLAWNRTFDLSNGGELTSRIQALWNDSRYEGYREDTLVQYEFDGYKVDSYTTIDWNVNYRPADANWNVGFYISNLTDEIVPNSLNGGGNPPEGLLALQPIPNGGDAYITGTLRSPREFGFRVGVDF